MFNGQSLQYSRKALSALKFVKHATGSFSPADIPELSGAAKIRLVKDLILVSYLQLAVAGIFSHEATFSPRPTL